MRVHNRSEVKQRDRGSCRGDVWTFPLDRILSSEGLDSSSFMGMILEKLPHGVFVCAADGKVIYSNPAARQLLPMKAKESPRLMVRPAGESRDGERANAPLETASPKALLGESLLEQECLLVRGDGSSRDVLCTMVPMSFDWQIVGCLAIMSDMTTRHDKELLLLQQAVSAERDRMAAEIHDTFAQGFNAILLQLETAEANLASNPAAVEGALRTAREVARDSLRDSRRSMWTLSQRSLDDADLASGLSVFAKRLFDGTPVKLELSLQQAGRRMSSEVHDALLNVGKESLRNALLHARAKTVRMELAYRECDVRLSVEDDGRGFVPTLVRNFDHGFGLLGMDARVRPLGGSVVVKSGRNGGTRLIALLPLRSHPGETAA